MDSLTIEWTPEEEMSDSELAYKNAGFVKTVGSVFIFGGRGQPEFPTAEELQKSFEAPNTPGGSSILSIGARALCKHCERKGPLKRPGIVNSAKNYVIPSHPYWTRPEGKEEEKNRVALSHLHDLLGNFDSAWKNIHHISPDTIVYEIRDPLTFYGMRWTVIVMDIEGSEISLQFRGFLEPNFS